MSMRYRVEAHHNDLTNSYPCILQHVNHLSKTFLCIDYNSKKEMSYPRTNHEKTALKIVRAIHMPMLLKYASGTL